MPRVALAFLFFAFSSTSWGDDYAGDGAPSAVEEELRWLLNRARFDLAGENTRHGTNFTDVVGGLWPLAPNASLLSSARNHSADMAAAAIMQHPTLPGSSFYDPATTIEPWDRAVADGYRIPWTFEVIARGGSTTADAHTLWFKSAVHRDIFYEREIMEIGVGRGVNPNDRYKNYYAMDLGDQVYPSSQRRLGSASHYFTGTCFSDTDGDGTYDQGEGVADIRVRLYSDGTFLDSSDTTGTSGAFAVPLDSLGRDASASIILTNTMDAEVTLDIPSGATTFERIGILPDKSMHYGALFQPSERVNVGFRTITPEVYPLVLEPKEAVAPDLDVHYAEGAVSLGWNSSVGFSYQVQRSLDGETWEPLSTPRGGTGEPSTATDPTPSAPTVLYRLFISEQ